MMKWLMIYLAFLVSPALAADDAPSLAANAAYLADNAKKPGTIVRPSGLQYRILRSGPGRRPGGDDVVRIGYPVRQINGTVVDSTAPVLPASLGMANVPMAGLAEALSLMHAGDRWQLVQPASLAFGAKGASNGVIPQNQFLLFV